MLLHKNGFNELVWDTKKGVVVGIENSLEDQNRCMDITLVESYRTVCWSQRVINVVLHNIPCTHECLRKCISSWKIYDREFPQIVEVVRVKVRELVFN